MKEITVNVKDRIEELEEKLNNLNGMDIHVINAQLKHLQEIAAKGVDCYNG